MATDIKSGRLGDLQKDYIGGWFIGSFVKGDSPFHSEDFEIKITEHKAGEVKESTNPEKSLQKTLGILLEGAFKMTFPEFNREVVLDEKEQYIYFYPPVSHFLTALEDTRILIIRWPSRV